MEMDFSVAQALLLDGLKAGDAVQFEVRHLKPDELAWGTAKIERNKRMMGLNKTGALQCINLF